MPKVSVIIPVYNTEEYLEKCIDSILNQDFNDLEIIIINDNSPDKSKNIIKRYLDTNMNIIFIDKNTNEGVSKARNDGIEIASGEYILFVDSDDFIEKNSIRKLYEFALNKNSDIVISNAYRCFLDGRVDNIKPKISNKISSVEGVKELLVQKNGLYGQPWNKFFKREFIVNNNIRYPVGITLQQDVVFNIEAFGKSKCIDYINEYTYYYIERDNSSIRNIDEKKVNDSFRIIKKVENIIKDLELEDQLQLQLNAFRARIISQRILSIVMTKKLNRSKKIKFIDIIVKNNLTKLYLNDIRSELMIRNYYIVSNIVRYSNYNSNIILFLISDILNSLWKIRKTLLKK